MDGKTKGSSNETHIVIVGAGIIGLSTAVALLAASPSARPYRITVVANKFSPHTTSDIAGGLWLPYKASHPSLNRWLEQTLDWYFELLDRGTLPIPDVQKPQEMNKNDFNISIVSGISFESGEELAFERESWKHIVRGEVTSIPLDKLERIPKDVKYAYQIPNMPLVVTTQYLKKLRSDLYSTGKVQFIQDQSLSSLKEAVKKYHADVLVNCSGLGSRILADDDQVFPVRGCLAIVELPTEVKEKLDGKIFLYDDNPAGLTYILPRNDYCYVGGTYHKNNFNSTCEEEEADEILKRAIEVLPALANGKKVGQKCGLRPGRTSIRMEQDNSFNNMPPSGQAGHSPLVFHNYGHGGSGWTIHWGCALDIAAMVEQALRNATPYIPPSKL